MVAKGAKTKAPVKKAPAKKVVAKKPPAKKLAVPPMPAGDKGSDFEAFVVACLLDNKVRRIAYAQDATEKEKEELTALGRDEMKKIAKKIFKDHAEEAKMVAFAEALLDKNGGLDDVSLQKFGTTLKNMNQGAKTGA
jgi:hypothetical protein